MIVPIKKASAVGRQIANDQQRTQSQLTGGYGSSYGYGNTGPAMPTSTKGINVNAKNLWNYYANNAQANGQLAMKDVAAQQTAQTEGYGNSWAQGAASNAYLDYLNQLNGNMAGIIASATPRKSGGGRAKQPELPDWYKGHIDPITNDILTRIEPGLVDNYRKTGIGQQIEGLKRNMEGLNIAQKGEYLRQIAGVNPIAFKPDKTKALIATAKAKPIAFPKDLITKK